MNLGLHLSIAGGLQQAVRQGRELNCQALQLFLGNPRRWFWQEPPESAVSLFRRAREVAGLAVVAAHFSYLLNLATADPQLAHRS